jgi:phosphoesterase RecJ-like protein
VRQDRRATGCFVYGNTNADTFRAAAELCEAGASNTWLSKVLFRTSSKARIMLEGMIYSGLRYYHNERTVFGIITREMMEEAGATEQDCTDISALPGRVEDCYSAAVIRDIGGNKSKISLRTNGLVDASAVCGSFGGGGHKMAAGCIMEKDCFTAADILAAAIAEYLDERDITC